MQLDSLRKDASVFCYNRSKTWQFVVMPSVKILQLIKKGVAEESVAYWNSRLPETDGRQSEVTFGVTWSLAHCFKGSEPTVKGYSSILCLNFLYLSPATVASLRKELENDPLAFAVISNAPGDGLAILVKVDFKDRSEHVAAYMQLMLYWLDKYAILATFDCQKSTYLFPIPHDPDLYVNSGSQVFVPARIVWD